MPLILWIVLALVCMYALYTLVVLGKYLMIRRAGRRAGVPLSFGNLIAMHRRKINPWVIIDAYKVVKQSELDVRIEQIEQHHTHGGRVEHVIEALRLAKSRNLRITWHDLCQQDLASHDVVQIIQKRIDEVDKPV